MLFHDDPLENGRFSEAMEELVPLQPTSYDRYPLDVHDDCTAADDES